jgi:SCF-associated factor 1
MFDEPFDARLSRLTCVLQGWAGSSAFIHEIGIVFWERLPESSDEPENTDGWLVSCMTVPGTAFKRSLKKNWAEDSIAARTGEVLNYVILDHHIVFITDLNKVYVYPARMDVPDELEPVELFTFTQTSPDFRLQDIQGSFRNFGVFSQNGAVLLGDSILLDAFMRTAEASSSAPSSVAETQLQPKIIPALQNASVISLAFGDWHFHALHADGTISSYGVESQACGALGLGPPYIAAYRGVYYSRHMGAGGTLTVPPWSSTGRRTIWFEREKLDWIRSMRATSQKDAKNILFAELQTRASLEWCQVYGEWFERQGAVWHQGPKGLKSDTAADDEGNGAYFALKVTAAGWHSAALVIVDQNKAELVRNRWKVPLQRDPETTPASPEKETSTDLLSSQAETPNVRGGQPITEHILQGVQRLRSTIVETGRTFLGLTARDETAAANSAADDSKRDHKERPWLWERQGLPRLKGIGGEIIPGEGEVAEWRGGEPDWSLVSDTSLAE